MSRRSGITITRLTGIVAPLLHRGLIPRRATVTRHLLVPIPLLLAAVIAAEAGVVAMVAGAVVVTVAADPVAEEATAGEAGIAAAVEAVTAVAVAAVTAVAVAADLMEVVVGDGRTANSNFRQFSPPGIQGGLFFLGSAA